MDPLSLLWLFFIPRPSVLWIRSSASTPPPRLSKRCNAPATMTTRRCGPTTHPLQVAEVTALGLPIRVGVPVLERDLMTLYPQPRGRTPAVEYVPGPPGPSLPRRREPPPKPRRE